MAKRQLHDRYFKQAKRDGYLARSAYKLLEIQRRRKILRQGTRVLDLGCAPGSWLQVASQIVGPRGTVVGVDLLRAARSLPANVRTIEGDFTEVDPAQLIELAGGDFHAVISDMAPNTSGSGDDLISARMCHDILRILPGLLRVGGSCCMKIFEGVELGDVMSEARRAFALAKGLKPKATRDVSREIYIVATGYKAPAPRAQPEPKQAFRP
ncbi:MAG: RlmE family RNA methyltransferase [Planctomycetota bacterium]